MTPTANRVLIQADKPKSQTASGLYIQEDWKSLPPTGTVLAVGPDVATLQPGDRVLFERYGSVVLENDQRMCIDSQVLAILQEESDDTPDQAD